MSYAMSYSQITEQTILNELHELTPDKWQEVLEFIHNLKSQDIENKIKKVNIDLRNIMGSCENIRGNVDKYIDEMRDERF